MNYNNFTGIGTALITPFLNDKLDLLSFKKIIENQIDASISYLVVAGSTGEISTLEEAEFELLVKTAQDIVQKKIPIVVNCNSSSTSKAIKIVQNIEKLGADGIMCTMPSYNRPSEEGIYLHYKLIAENSSLPIMIYNVPSRTGVDITDNTIIELSKIPNIIGIKDASNDILKPLRLNNKISKEFTFISGNDDSVLSYIANGGKGLISVASNIFPKHYVSLINNALAGNFIAALQIQKELRAFIEAISYSPNPTSIKYAASLKKLCAPELRLPLTLPNINCQKLIAKALEDLIE